MKLPAGIPTAKDTPPTVSVVVRLTPEQAAEAVLETSAETGTATAMRDYVVKRHNLEFTVGCSATVKMLHAPPKRTDIEYNILRIGRAAGAYVVGLSSSAAPKVFVPLDGADVFVWDGPSACNPVL